MSENYEKCSLEEFKKKINDWLDWNMELIDNKGGDEPEFQLKRENKKLLIRVTEKGSSDRINEGENYYMILESLKDESQINQVFNETI